MIHKSGHTNFAALLNFAAHAEGTGLAAGRSRFQGSRFKVEWQKFRVSGFGFVWALTACCDKN